MGYTALRDSFKISLSKYGFDSELAEGSANIEFIDSAGSPGSLPHVGDILYDYGYYCGGSASASYPLIRCSGIEKAPYHVEAGADAFKYICSFDSGAGSSNDGFSGDTTVIGWDSPDKWRLATSIAGTASVTGDIFGSFDAKQSRIVPSGQFSKQIAVSDFNLSPFWFSYLDIVGKLNAEAVIAIAGDTAGIEFSRGQLLCSGITLNGKSDDGLYNFSVDFKWRIINAKNIVGDIIGSDDFNYYLVPNTGGTYRAGWVAPVQVTGSSSTAIADPAFTYEYAGTDKYSDLIDTDWTTI